MNELTLTAGSATVVIDADRGGRLASFEVGGHQLLVVDPTDDPLLWGSYPMVPFAGRVRGGRFRFRDQDVALPHNLGPHAIHGYGFTSVWEVVDDNSLRLALPEPWPFRSTAAQRFELDDAGLTMRLSVTAHEAMPVQLGWHPWFQRFLTAADGGRVEADLRFGPAQMYAMDDAGMPTGELVAQPEGPWDNCFVDLARTPTISWPGLVDLTLTSGCDHWVVYTEPIHGLCVEPQTAAPDVFNREPEVLEADETRTAWFRIAWA